MKYVQFRFISFSQIFFLFVLILSCAQGPEKKEEIIQNHPGGDVSRRYTRIEGKKDGQMIDYYPDGSIAAERFFENDIQVGKTTLYYRSGGIKEVQYYNEGKIHGGDTVFYENGKPQLIMNLDHGLKHGYLRKFNAEGQMTYEARYDKEVLVEVNGERLHRDSSRVRDTSDLKLQ